MTFSDYNLIEIGLVTLAFGVLIFGAFQQVAHLKLSPLIATPEDLEGFRELARLQMYLTIGFLALVIPAIALIFIDPAESSLLQKLVMCLPYAVVGIGGSLMKILEKKVRDAGRCVPELREEFNLISHVWGKKLFPSF